MFLLQYAQFPGGGVIFSMPPVSFPALPREKTLPLRFSSHCKVSAIPMSLPLPQAVAATAKRFRVLGVDPAVAGATGYGVIELDGTPRGSCGSAR